MLSQWYLIVGLAKTGTTAVAMTLRNTLRVSDFCIEPKELATIEQAVASRRLVIKIIFDHWKTSADTLKAFVRNSVGERTLATIAIVRDPRDEAVSRLHYAAFDYFSTRPTTDDQRAAWIEIFRRKEETPDSISLIDMQNEIVRQFGRRFLPAKDLYETYCRFIDDIMDMDATAVHLLRYEDFVRDTIPNKALQAMLSGSRDVGAELRRVYRSGSSGDWQHFLTGNDLVTINTTCEPFLRRFNYPFERISALGRPSAATGSDYVAKLIDEARSQFRGTEPRG
jgi:Sulfotransferase domain